MKTPNWLQRILPSGPAGKERDVIAAQVGERARNVVVGKNVIQIGTLAIPLYLAILIAAGVLITAGAGILNVYFDVFSTPQPPPPVPTPTPHVAGHDIGVAVAKFAVAEGIDRSDADLFVERFGNLLERELRESLSGARMTVGFLGPAQMARIEGSNANQREDHARRLAQDHGASIVVYGIIDRHSTTNQIQIQPEFYVVPESFVDALEMTGSFRFGDRILSSGPLANLLDVEGIMSARTLALAHVMEGLARTEVQDFGAAQAAFERALAVSDWAEAEGKEVVYVLLGNTFVRLAQEAATQCNRTEVLDQTSRASDLYGTARELAPDFARAYTGLASATYLSALWLREQNANCAAQLVDVESLQTVLDLVEEAQSASDQPKEIGVATKLLLVKAQALFALWNTEAAFEEERYAELRQQFWNTTEQILRNYENGDYPAVAPLVIESYGLRGTLLQIEGACREALAEYESGLGIASIEPARRMVLVGWQGDCYVRLGQLELAATAYTEALQIAQVLEDPVAQDYYAALQAEIDRRLQTGEPAASGQTSSGSAQSSEPAPDRAQPEVVRVRQTAPPNTLVGVSYSLGGAISAMGDEKCIHLSSEIAGITSADIFGYDVTQHASGATVPVTFEVSFENLRAAGAAVDNAFAFPVAAYLWAWAGFSAPRICATFPVEAVAIAPDGEQVEPSVIRYEPAVEPGEVPRTLYIVRLPLYAYAQPGKWQLVVEEPVRFELGIDVAEAQSPIYLREGERYQLLGFAPNERIVGVVYNRDWSLSTAQWDTFEHQVDGRGSAYVELTGINGPVFITGEAGSTVAEVSANWYPDIFDFRHVEGYSFGRSLWESYWLTPTAQMTATIAATVTEEAVPMHAEPDENAAIIGQLTQGEQITFIGRDLRGTWLQLESGQTAWVPMGWSPRYQLSSSDLSKLPVTAAPEPVQAPDRNGVLAYGVMVRSLLDNWNGEEWTLEAQAGDSVVVMAQAVDRGEDLMVFVPRLELFDADGKVVAEGQTNWETDVSRVAVWDVPETGVFSVRVQPWSMGGPGLYTLSASRITVGTGGVAGELRYGDSVQRTPQGDGSETWLFVGAADERVSVAGDEGTKLQLHDPSGAELISVPSIDDYTLTRDGVYSLVVGVQAGVGYTVSMELVGLAPGPGVLTSPGMFSIVHPVRPDIRLDATSAQTQDTWRFFGARGDEARVTVQSERSISVHLVGPHNEELADDFGYGTAAITYTLPVTGQYSTRVPTPDPFRVYFSSEPLAPSQCAAGCALLRYGESITGTVQAWAGEHPTENAWRFVGHAGDHVAVTVQGGAQALRLQAYRPDEERMGCEEDAGPGQITLTCLLPEHGQYTVVVYGSRPGSAPYLLTLAARR